MSGVAPTTKEEVRVSPFLQNAVDNGIDWTKQVIRNLQNRGSVPENLVESELMAAIDRLCNHVNGTVSYGLLFSRRMVLPEILKKLPVTSR